MAEPVYLDDDHPEFLRLSGARRWANAVGLPLLYASGGFSPAHFWWVDVIGFSIAVIAVLGVSRIVGSEALELHRGYLVLRRGWFSRAAAACDIDDVRIERRSRWASRQLTIVMENGKRHRAYEAGRRRGLLRTNFAGDLQCVRDWWLANRDLDVVVVQVNASTPAA